MNRFLSEMIGVNRNAHTATGTTTITSASIDMQTVGADGVMFLVGIQTAAADNILKVQVSDNNSDWSDLTGGAVVPGASDEAQFVDVKSPPKRYVRASVARGTGTILGDIWALTYRHRQEPVDNTTAGTIAGVAVQG